MKTRTSIVILSLLLCSFLTLQAQMQYDTVLIYQQGGVVDRYATSDIDTISYNANQMQVLKTDASTVNYDMALLDSMVFQEKEVSLVVYCDTIFDYDSNQYYAVQIGNQCWMAENLKVTHYADGTPIPHVTGDANWAAIPDNDADTARAYCWYNDDEAMYKDLYGALYTYAAATNSNNSGMEVQGVCPMGWRLPSDADWDALVNALGGAEIAGGILKATSGWDLDGNGTDDVGFSALPRGERSYFTGSFDFAGGYGYWWSATDESGTYARYRSIYYNVANVISDFLYKSYGYSVRCVRDVEPEEPPLN